MWVGGGVLYPSLSFRKRLTYNCNVTLTFFRRSFFNSASGENVFLCEKNNYIDFSNNCMSLNLCSGFMQIGNVFMQT